MSWQRVKKIIMKFVKSLALLSLVGVLLSGCASTAPSAHASRHFNEAKAANVVLQFSSWEYTFLLQPRYDDNGFLLQVPREKVGEVLKQMNVQQRDLAVVVVGWNYAPDQLHKLVADWKTILSGCGFHRVVVLKSAGKELNGALVIDDEILSGGNPPSITQL